MEDCLWLNLRVPTRKRHVSTPRTAQRRKAELQSRPKGVRQLEPAWNLAKLRRCEAPALPEAHVRGRLFKGRVGGKGQELQ